MTTQLPERLRALADEAPESLSGPALWQAGRRRHRMRVVTAAAVTGGLVLALAALGFGDWQSRRPDPAAPPATQSGPMSIPDRFFTPSPWLPSTDKPGRLVAVIGRETRQHLPFGSDDDSVVGVAAGSQRYSFLDLPGRTVGTDVSLAPDGLHLAYVIDGTTSEDRESYAGGGLAVLDLATGRVETHLIETEHGLDNQTFTWVDGQTLFIDENYFIDGPGHHSRIHHEVLRWVMGSPAVSAVRLRPRFALHDPVTAPGGVGAMVSGRSLHLIDPASGQTTSVIKTNRATGQVALDVATRQVAGLAGRGSPARLLAGVVRAGRADLAPVSPIHSRWYGALGWSDGRHVVAVRLRTSHQDPLRLMSVDVRTKRAGTLSRYGSEVEFARDAIRDATSAAAVSPPRPWNSRAVAGGLLTALLGAGAALLLLRSRRVRR